MRPTAGGGQREEKLCAQTTAPRRPWAAHGLRVRTPTARARRGPLLPSSVHLPATMIGTWCLSGTASLRRPAPGCGAAPVLGGRGPQGAPLPPSGANCQRAPSSPRRRPPGARGAAGPGGAAVSPAQPWSDRLSRDSSARGPGAPCTPPRGRPPLAPGRRAACQARVGAAPAQHRTPGPAPPSPAGPRRAVNSGGACGEGGSRRSCRWICTPRSLEFSRRISAGRPAGGVMESTMRG